MTNGLLDPTPNILEYIDLEAAIAQLRPRDRLIVDLWMQGYTQKAIATRLGVWPQAICERLPVIFSSLRTFLS